MADAPGEAERISLYIRVAASLRSRLGNGEWGVGSRLPTVERLAEEYGVARVTVRHALHILAGDGLVTSTRGRGTVVAEAIPPALTRAGHRTAINDRLEFSRGDGVKILSRRIVSDIPPNMQPVEKAAPRHMRIEKLHTHDGQPFAFVDCVVELNAYRRFPKDADKKSKILKLLLDAGGMTIARGRQEITVTHADSRLAGALKCSIASALVQVRSWRHDQNGTMIFGTATLYRGDRFIFDVSEENFSYDQASPLVIPKYRTP